MNDSSEKIVNQLLTELDGVEELEKVIIIAATNRRDLIDPALLRSGRIDAIVELGIPDEKTREEIFKVHTSKMPLDKAVKILDYVKKTAGWTGAEIEAIARNAGVIAIKRVYSSKKKEDLTISKEDFDSALKEVSHNSGKEISEEKSLVSGKKKEKVKPKYNKG